MYLFIDVKSRPKENWAAFIKKKRAEPSGSALAVILY